ncbi:hypothetical protein TPB0596_04690 [Tsukamurella pulmonis]|uniref:hypothetical protein n=1 Tax=Tsukamurella pulmonis TaxID=47312 RepID=UPI001EE10D12|nr:hypothetical protein [Tsukamurella pulmonis]BDD80706.1 hypothetical protein TPB0596_04690 [Tsukamurella pulmonis]
MNKNRFLGTVALAATILTAACTTTGEPVAAPSPSIPASPSSTAPASAADAVDAGRAAAARLGLPYLGLDAGSVEAAAAKGLPYLFGAGLNCGWIRLPDGSLYALHNNRTGSAHLVRDRGIEAAWKADPDFEPGACTPAEGIPTSDDPAAPEPYRWVGAYDTRFLRWHGRVFILPGTVGPGPGLALRPTN